MVREKDENYLGSHFDVVRELYKLPLSANYMALERKGEKFIIERIEGNCEEKEILVREKKTRNITMSHYNVIRKRHQ